MNRITRHIAPWTPGFGVVIHRGRRSGREYQTPVNVFAAEDGYVLALTYGPDTDWVKNVLAAGGCELRTRGRAIRLVSPRLGQVQSPADQRMPAAGGIGQGHRHLAQRDTAHGAAVLAGRAGRVARGLLIGRLIHDQDPIPVIEVTDRPRRRDVRNALFVPDRTRQQMLQPVRPAMPGRLGDRPAVMIFQLHQQPADHLAAGLPGLPPRKAPGHPPQQIRQQRGPGIIRYRGSRDCRILIVSHNPS